MHNQYAVTIDLDALQARLKEAARRRFVASAEYAVAVKAVDASEVRIKAARLSGKVSDIEAAAVEGVDARSKRAALEAEALKQDAAYNAAIKAAAAVRSNGGFAGG